MAHRFVNQTRLRSYFEVNDLGIRNRELIVIVPEILPPFVNYLNISYEYEKERGYGPGIVWQVLRILGEHLNLTYMVETVEMNSDLRWNDAFKMLKNTDAEIIVGATVMQYHAAKNITFTLPFQYEQTGLLYQMSTDHLFNRQRISFGPFSAQIWLVAAFCIFFSALITRMSALHIQKLPKDKSMLDHCLTFFSVLCRHSVNLKSGPAPDRILTMTWYLGSLVLFVIYMVGSAFMPNYSAATIPFKTIKSVVDTFVSSNQYKLVLNENSGRTQMFKKSVLKDIKRLWEHVAENDAVVYAETIEDGIELVRQNHNYFFMGPLDTFKLVANRDCRLRVVPEGFLAAFMGIALKEDSPYVRPLDRVILELVQFGFIEKWIRGYGLYMSASFNGTCEPVEEGHFFALKTSILRGPFIIFGVGIVFGALFFVAEHARWLYLNSRMGRRLHDYIIKGY
ncbi:hypothetical protein M3Y97_01054300 [Aphelenchoides bicaudatus]|nr:hypothetical protein M3Y97_01054300 [Aphelenchoides bicaudatus]